MVDYGTTISLGSLAGQPVDAVTSHSVALSGLSSDTLYYFQVRSTDSAGNTITDNNSGNYYTFTTTADTTAPTISNISTEIVSDTQIAIIWETNELSTSQVEYGTTDSYGSETILDTTLTIQHAVEISSLTAETTYHFRVKSIDAGDNEAISSDSTFTTQSATGTGDVIIIRRGDRSPPSISNIEVSEITQTSVTISWRTSEGSSSLVGYGTTSDYGSLAGNLLEIVVNHEVKLFNLSSETTYYYKIFSYDASGNRGSSGNRTLTTLQEGEIPVGEEEEEEEEEEEIPDEEEDILDKIKAASRIFFVKILQALSLNPFLSEIPEEPFVSSVSEMASQIITSPVIVEGYPQIVEIGANAAKIIWVTDKESNSILATASDIDYDIAKTEAYTIIMGNPDEESLNHEVEVIGLESATLYHYEVRSKSKFGEWTQSGDRTFTTLSLTAEISDIKFLAISEKEVTLSWKTTLPTRTLVELTDTSTGEKTTQDDPSYLREHEFIIDDLKTSTNYTLQIFADDEEGSRAFSPILPFTTVVSLEPPEISQVRITTSIIPGRVEKVQTIISWKTDKPSTSRIYFEEGISTKDALAFMTPLEKEFVLDHIIITTAFKTGRVYRFRVESIDASGNTSYSKDYTILTPRPRESILDLMIKNFEEIFSFLKRVRF